MRRPDGDEPGEAERKLYRVTVNRPDGSSDEINPVALAELEDRDNNHFLCLKTADPAVVSTCEDIEQIGLRSRFEP